MPENCRNRILSDDYFDVITDFPVRVEEPEQFDLCQIDVEDLYRLVYVSRREIPNPETYFYEHRSMPKLYGLMAAPGDGADTGGLIASGILQLQREPLALTGRGCVIVFIDTGIDYTNPAFRKPDGSTRILAIWDQTVQIGEPPAGLPYGTEYTASDINRALASETPYTLVPSRDENGHGSNLAAVAAGSRSHFPGAAPDADIVVVKLKECKPYFRQFYMIPEDVPAYQETDIMLGCLYGERFADTFRRPVVYCLGLGTNYGDHEGNSALSRYINHLAVKRSRTVVVAGGNEGNVAHHYRGSLSPALGTTRVPVEIRVGEGADGFLLQFWGKIPDVYTMSVRSPGGEVIAPVRLGLNDIITYSFIYEKTRITIAGNLVEAGSGEELITLRVERPTPGIWTFQVEAVGEIHNGSFHMWLPITEFMNRENFFLESTPYTTITEPSPAPYAITVGAYNSLNGSLYAASGRGFSSTGVITPDLAAPGVNVPVLRGTATGTSLAAAITAGAVAQFMQWAVVEGNNPVVESREIKSYLVRGAGRSADMTYPNREWGYGRLNMVGTFNALVGV